MVPLSVPLPFSSVHLIQRVRGRPMHNSLVLLWGFDTSRVPLSAGNVLQNAWHHRWPGRNKLVASCPAIWATSNIQDACPCLCIWRPRRLLPPGQRQGGQWIRKTEFKRMGVWYHVLIKCRPCGRSIGKVAWRCSSIGERTVPATHDVQLFPIWLWIKLPTL